MMVQQQELLKSDLRCRLAVPSLHVPRSHLSGHWDPDALARWHTMMSYLVSFLELHPPAQKLLLDHRTGAGKLMVKLGLVSSNG
jgi:hypothetical protein